MRENTSNRQAFNSYTQQTPARRTQQAPARRRQQPRYAPVRRTQHVADALAHDVLSTRFQPAARVVRHRVRALEVADAEQRRTVLT